MNPEFKRQLWLEVSSHRLISTPLILGLLFALGWLSDEQLGGDVLFSMCLGAFGIVTILWGGKLVVNAYENEIVEKTWDIQRLSSMSPWALCWGKWLGGPVIAWYGGVLTLIVLAFFGLFGARIDYIVTVVFVLISLALFFHAAALFAAIQSTSAVSGYQKSRSTYLKLLAVIFAISSLFLPAFGEYMDDRLFDIDWYGEKYTALYFNLFALYVFMAWLLIGSYRLMRAELQYHNGFVVWLVFSLFVPVFLAGFAGNEEGISLDGDYENVILRFQIAYWVLMLLAYSTLLSSEHGHSVFQRLKIAIASRKLKAIYLQTPLWMVSLFLVVVSFVILQLLFMIGGVTKPENEWALQFFNISILLFFMRDLAVVYWVYLSLGVKRPDTTAIVYLLILHIILPMLMGLAAGERFSGLFSPRGLIEEDEPHIVVLISAVVQIGLFSFMAYMVGKRRA